MTLNEIFRESSQTNCEANRSCPNEAKLRLNQKFVYIFLFLFISISRLNAQSYNIDYYGIVSQDIDSNMAKMTNDLFYTQLTEINSFSVADKRTDTLLSQAPDSNAFSNSRLSFYITIEKEINTEKWATVYHVIDKRNEIEQIKTNHYDSFYKILMESKATLKETIKNLIENGSDETYIAKSSHSSGSGAADPSSSKNTINSTEVLSGTWRGEENINKIVILRGGRGFIIFKNGASMNVSVAISDASVSQVTITQNGKANASFYPELPRNVALNAAISAEPIKWTLTYKDDSTLTGIKQTLIPDGESFTSGDITVEWKKIN